MAVRRQGNEILDGLNRSFRAAQGPQRPVTAGNAQVATGVAPNPRRPQPTVRQPASASGKTGPNAGRPRVPQGGLQGGALFAGRPNIGGYGQSGPFIPAPERDRGERRPIPGFPETGPIRRRPMPQPEAPLPPGADRRESGKIVYPRAPKPAPKAPVQTAPPGRFDPTRIPQDFPLPPNMPQLPTDPRIGQIPIDRAPLPGEPGYDEIAEYRRRIMGLPPGAQIPGGGYTGGTDVLRERMRNVAGQTPEQARAAAPGAPQAGGVQGGPAGVGPRINPNLGSIEEGPGGSLVTLNEMGKQAYRRMRQDAVRRFGKWPGSDNPLSPQPEILPGQPMFNPFGTGWVE